MAATNYDGADVRALVTAGDLSTSQWRGVTTDAAGLLVRAGSNQRHLVGVLISTPPAGKSGSYVTEGQVKVEAGAAIPLVNGGTPLTTDSVGRFVAATTGQHVQAIAYKTAAAAGELIEAELGYKGLAA